MFAIASRDLTRACDLAQMARYVGVYVCVCVCVEMAAFQGVAYAVRVCEKRYRVHSDKSNLRMVRVVVLAVGGHMKSKMALTHAGLNGTSLMKKFIRKTISVLYVIY